MYNWAKVTTEVLILIFFFNKLITDCVIMVNGIVLFHYIFYQLFQWVLVIEWMLQI